jgi:hypothetical protein
MDYSHIREQAKREAVHVLSAQVPQRQITGNYGANLVSSEHMPSYLLEKMVGTSGFEPLTSTVSR